MTDRAIAIVRVSQRDKDAISPEVQTRSVKRMAGEHGWTLDPHDILDENVDDNGKVRNVSASWALEDRLKLRYAIEEVEAKRAKVIIAERFDRMFRNEILRRMVLQRIQDAGGELWSDKTGEMTNQKAEGRFAHNVTGDMSEYTLQTAKERSWDTVEIAIENGTFNGPKAPLGYLVGADRKLEPDKATKQIAVDAFTLRAGGATAKAVKAMLAERGVKRSLAGVRQMLASRVYVGELHAGGHTPNLKAHPAIVDRDVFERVQRMTVPAGRNAKSDRLLARLGKLRCGTCDGRMSASRTGRGYAFYRCASTECARPVTISATVVERLVERAMPGLLVSLVGHASEVEQYEAAKAAMRTAAARYAAFTADYDPLEPADVERRQELRAVLSAARAKVTSLEGSVSSGEFPIGARWDDLPFAMKRRGIKLRVERIVVAPGRGDGRVTIDPFPVKAE
jgi:DNA invertase Pin-like site-specific DNA recombinase